MACDHIMSRQILDNWFIYEVIGLSSLATIGRTLPLFASRGMFLTQKLEKKLAE